jgi:hypothetical protein
MKQGHASLLVRGRAFAIEGAPPPFLRISI